MKAEQEQKRFALGLEVIELQDDEMALLKGGVGSGPEVSNTGCNCDCSCGDEHNEGCNCGCGLDRPKPIEPTCIP